MNHFRVTQTSKRTVNIKVTIEIKVQHKHCTTTNLIMISLLLNNRLHIIYLSLKYHDFADIFQTAEKQSLFEKSPHDHVIDLELSQQPLFRMLYSMFSAELNVLKVYLNNAMKTDIIHKSISSAASSVMFVLKSDSSLQLIIDYRYLNSITIKNWYSLSLILNMLNCL